MQAVISSILSDYALPPTAEKWRFVSGRRAHWWQRPWDRGPSHPALAAEPGPHWASDPTVGARWARV